MFFLLWYSTFTIPGHAQEARKNVIYSYFEGQQPNSQINVKMGRDAATGLTGQEFTIVIKNLTQHKLKIYGRYFAKLVCGNTKDGNIEIELKPGEVKGGNAYLFDADGLTQTVQAEDCKAVNDNRIKNLGFQITSITDLTTWEQEKAAQPPESNSTSNINTYSNSSSAGSHYNSYSTKKDSYNNSSSYNRNQTIVNNLNMQLENNRRTMDAVTSGMQQFSNMLEENAARKQAQREAEAESRKQEEEIREQEAVIRAQEEAEQQAKEAEARRQREAAEEAERGRQWNIDLQIWGNYGISRKTATVADNIQQVYYLVYERSYVTGKVKVKTYALNKYSDDTWMLQSDLLDKIGFKNYFGNAGVGQLLGAYEDRQTATAAINHIKAQAPDAIIDNSFLEINGAGTKEAAGTDTDFWNN